MFDSKLHGFPSKQLFLQICQSGSVCAGRQCPEKKKENQYHAPITKYISYIGRIFCKQCWLSELSFFKTNVVGMSIEKM